MIATSSLLWKNYIAGTNCSYGWHNVVYTYTHTSNYTGICTRKQVHSHVKHSRANPSMSTNSPKLLHQILQIIACFNTPSCLSYQSLYQWVIYHTYLVLYPSINDRSFEKTNIVFETWVNHWYKIWKSVSYFDNIL